MKKFMSCLILLLATSVLWAQNPPTLTLSQALERGLAREDLKAALQGRVDEASGTIEASRLWDNPELSLSTESIDQGGISADESYLLVSQRIQLFGRASRMGAAQKMKVAVDLENRGRRQEIGALVQNLFFETLYYQKRVAILSSWNSRLDGLLDVAIQREKAGEASGYDVRRLSREQWEARAMAAREEAYRLAGWEQLAALLQIDVPHLLSGHLLPQSENRQFSASLNPKLLALDAMVEAALLEEQALKNRILQELTLEAGLKKTSFGGESDQGFYLGVKTPLPLFNRNQARRMQATARALTLSGEKAMAQSEAEGRIRGLTRQYGQLRKAVEQYNGEMLHQSRELVRIAGAAYEQGEMDVLRLLDAYRSLRDAELKMADMEAEARTCFIELESLGGDQ